MSRKPRINLPQSVRKYVLERDNYQCQSCGIKNTEAELNIDHITALAKGGSDDLSNLQVLCRQCNQKKKHHFDSRFQRYYD
jgi:5-methylcytosine-specific restriction enzyme A